MGFWKKLFGLDKKTLEVKPLPVEPDNYKVNSVEDVKKLAEPAKKAPAKKPAAKKSDAPKKAPAKKTDAKTTKKSGTGAGGKGTKKAR